MNFSHFFIRRPIFAGVLSVLVLLLGLLAMGRLPISEYPEVTPPTIVVRAAYPGANPKTISETVAAPLEQAINGVENSIYMLSQATSDGVMTLTVTFKLGTDVDLAQVQVQNRVSQALPKLPEDVRRLGVTTVKQSPDLTMVVHLLSPEGKYDEIYLRNYATLQVKDVLARLPGVGAVEVFGGGDYAMRVWLDPEKIAARDMTAGDVVAAIREQNVQVAAGAIGQQPAPNVVDFSVQVRTKGRLIDEEEFGDIVVKQGSGGEKVLLKHVARVELGAGDYALRSLLNNQTAVGIPLFQLPGSNAIQISKDVRAAMVTLAENFPDGLEYQIAYDPTVFVQHSIDAVVVTLLEAIFLVVLVVVLFLQTWRASLIPLAAVPVSLVGTFAVMHALGYGINALSLFGLVLAIGIVVDDAIVVVENVERNISNGLSPVEATKKAMSEVTGPIIATTLVLSAVFIPTAFITGLTGQFYEQFAITIAISTIISTFNSLTLSPALCALLLQPHGARKDFLGRAIDFLFGAWLFRPFNWLFERGSGLYGRTVAGVIRIAVVIVLIYGGLVGATYWSFKTVPSGFVPAQDKQYLIAFAQLPDASSLDRTDDVIRRMSEIAMAQPGVESTVAFPGLSIIGFSISSNAGLVFVTLDPFEKRTTPELSAFAIAGALNQKYAGIQDAYMAIFPPPPVNGLGATGGFKLFVEDRADAGSDALYAATWGLIEKMHQTPGLAGALSSFQVNVPQLEADVDRDKAMTQGVPLAGVFDAMQINLGSVYVNDFNRFGRTYQVIAQADAPFRDEASDITRLKVRNDRGQMVPLGSIVDVRESYGPDRATRYNGYPAAEILGEAAPGFSSGEAEAAMEKLAEASLPAGMKYEWTDLTYQRILAGDSAIYVFPLSILLVFLVLAAQYESFRMPLAILLIVPMTLLSAMVGVILTGGDNNVFTQIGLIVLIGLAAKNAILIVEFAKVKQDEGLDPASAAIEASKLRLRPILMTSIAFIAGVFPLVTSTGAGSEMRHAMGVAVFSGMIGVTFFGLLLTPLFYALLLRIGWKKHHATTPAPTTPTPTTDGGGHGIATSVGHASVLLLIPLLALGSCTTVGPDYERPEVPSAPAWQDGPEAKAFALDEIPAGAWWKLFGDPALDALQERVAAENHDLKAALARIEQALASTKSVRASLYPSITADPTWTRTEYSPNSGLSFGSFTASDITVPVNLAWEVDLWGRVRRAVEAGERDVDALSAAFEALKLSLHAEVASSWFTLRALDLELLVLQQSVEVRRNALELIQFRYDAGTMNELDLARTQNEVAVAEAEFAAVSRRRAELRNALAVLAGQAPSTFELELDKWTPGELPEIPAGLPSDLLERRPDVAQAERELAARNARIGVAEAAFFPSLRLTGYGGVQSGELNNIFETDSRIWQLAPSLSIPIFEGGRLEADEARARAAFDEGIEIYRQRVLVAFREVQNALTSTKLLAQQSEAQERAVKSAQRASQLSRTRFDAGFVSYLDVIDGDRTRLAAERARAQLLGLRFVNAVELVRALGGGWNANTLPEMAAKE